MLHERVPWKTVAATLTGGLLTGCGARLAYGCYGCNTGAYFGGLELRPLFGLANPKQAGSIYWEPGLQHLLEYGPIYRLPPPAPPCCPR